MALPWVVAKWQSHGCRKKSERTEWGRIKWSPLVAMVSHLIPNGRNVVAPDSRHGLPKFRTDGAGSHKMDSSVGFISKRVELVVAYIPNGRNGLALYKMVLALNTYPYCGIGGTVSGFTTGLDRDVFERSLFLWSRSGMIRSGRRIWRF